MPWNDLPAWYACRAGVSAACAPPLSLVTLRAAPGSDRAVIDFHRDAEFGALVDWAGAGIFVLGFASIDRDELVLLCALDVAETERGVAQLPLVAAGLAVADIRSVAALRLTPPLDLAAI